MKTARILALLLLTLASFASAQEARRAPRGMIASGDTGSIAENQLSGLYLGGVELTINGGQASISVAKLANQTGQPTYPLRLEIWATAQPPVFGQQVNVFVLGSFDLPFVLAPSEIRQNVQAGPFAYVPPTSGSYYLTIALLEFAPQTAEYLYADLYTLPSQRRFGPAIILGSLPRGLVQRIGTGGATDDFVVANIGNAPATIAISQIGDFFQLNPTSFVVQAGERQKVGIIAGSRNAGYYKGEALIAVNGQQRHSVPIRLLAANSPAGSVKGGALSKRVDVSAADGTDPRGAVTFTNSGSSALQGFPVADSPWIIPDDGLVTIPPNGSATVGFTCKRDLRTDTTSPGVSGTMSLIYVLGTASARATMETPSTSLAGVVVTDTKQPQSATGAIPALKTGEVALLVPGVGHVVGSGNKEFVSDLSVVNGVLGQTVGDLQMYYSSPAASKAAPTNSLAPAGSLNLADVVTSYFGETGQVGTLQLRSKSLSGLSISANVFNKSNPAGTYGTAIPAFRTDRALASGQKLVLTGLRQDATSHTNVYLQEMSGAGNATATIEFFDRTGAKLGTLNAPTLTPFGLVTVPGTPANVPVNSVTAVVTSTSGSLSAYATPVDDASGDTWAVADWSRQFSLTGSEPTIIPVAGALAGANNTNFRTDASITNTGSTTATVELTYNPTAGAPAVRTQTLAPNQASTLEDIVPSFFNVAGTSLGWIGVKPQGGAKFAVTSRTYTKKQGDPATFGTGVTTVPYAMALNIGQSRTFGGLEDSTTATVLAAQGATFRTNLSLVEVGGKSAVARVSVYFADGRQLAAGGAQGVKDVPLLPNQFVQLVGLVKSVIGDSRETDFPDLRGVQVKIEVTGGTGSVLPFVTSTDNGTGDTVLRTE